MTLARTWSWPVLSILAMHFLNQPRRTGPRLTSERRSSKENSESIGVQSFRFLIGSGCSLSVVTSDRWL